MAYGVYARTSPKSVWKFQAYTKDPGYAKELTDYLAMASQWEVRVVELPGREAIKDNIKPTEWQ